MMRVQKTGVKGWYERLVYKKTCVFWMWIYVDLVDFVDGKNYIISITI